MTDADLARYFSDLHLEPVSAMTLVPGRAEDWFLLAAVSAARSGRFVIAGIEVDYQVGGQHGSTVYHNSSELDVAPSHDPSTSH